MTVLDTLGLGFMAFALFLGASNFIFPPLIGVLSGENLVQSMLGFLISAVGLPLITLVAVAKAKGNMVELLPPFVGLLLMAVIYIVLGPAYAIPRTGLVAYEIGLKPFISEPSDVMQFYYTLLFFGLAMLFALYPGRLLDTIGKVLTPAMIFLLLILAGSLFFFDHTVFQAAVGKYAHQPFISGFLDGYNTMDALGSIIFGMLLIETLKSKGVTKPADQSKYLIAAGFIAALGLIVVYTSLFVLGGLTGTMLESAENGGMILTTYVQHIFGGYGLVILAIVVTLACLTTAVGLLSSCAQFFQKIVPSWSYKQLVIGLTITCVVISNVGLEQLIQVSIPVLYIAYPVAVVLVALTFVRDRFAAPEMSYKLCLVIAFFYGLLDALKAIGMDLSFIYELNEEGLGWVLPSFIVMCALLKIDILPTQKRKVPQDH